MTMKKQLDELDRKERLTLIRNWSFGLGLMVCAIAITTIFNTLGNPITWSSAYHALAADGKLQWLAYPLLGLGVVLLITSLITAVLLGKQ